MRRFVKPTTPLEHRIAEQVDAIRAQAEALPPGSKERMALERRIRRAESHAHMHGWLLSSGLQPAK